MTYVVLHLIIAELLLVYISNIANPIKNKWLSYRPENKVFFIVTNVAFLFLTLLFKLYVKNYLLSFFVRTTLLLCVLSMIYISIYFLQFAGCVKRFGSVIIKIIFTLLGFYFLFLMIKDINFTDAEGFIVNSLPLFPDNKKFEKLTSFIFVILLYAVVVPFISSLAMLSTLLVKKQFTIFKQAFLISLTSFISWSGLFLAIYFVNSIYPQTSIITFIMAVGLQSLVIRRISRSDINAMSFVLFLGNIAQYVVPGILFALIYVKIISLSEKNIYVFLLLLSVIVILFLIITNYIGEFIISRRRIINLKKDKEFEEELKSLSYSETKEKIVSNFLNILNRKMKTSALILFVNNGEEKLTEVFDSSKSEESNALSFPFTKKMEALLIKNNKTIFRKSELESTVFFENYKNEVKYIFEKTHSGAFLLMTNKKHVTSILFLGDKTDNGKYNRYEARMISKLYSYFFVFTYYLINVAPKKSMTVVENDRIASEEISLSVKNGEDTFATENFDFGSFAKQASISSGDLLDEIKINKTHVLYIIGNISGRGLNVNIFGVLLKSAVRKILLEVSNFKQLVVKVNEYICENFPRGLFFSGMFAIADFTNDDFYYVNCGIPSINVLSNDINKIIEVKGSGRVLGFMNGIEKLISVKKVHLKKDDIVLTYTSGILENQNMDNPLLRQDRIQSLLLANTTYSAERICRFIYDDFAKTEDIDNDVTIMVLKRF